MVLVINPYKKGSRSAKGLKAALSTDYRTFISSKPPSSHHALIVNWGNSEFDYNSDKYPNVVNRPSVLGVMTNKLKFFNSYGHGDMVPEWTVSAAEAAKWGSKLLARQVLEGSGGAGIVIWDPLAPDATPEPPKAPLYVKYENKTHEYRLHMARGLHHPCEFYPLLIQRKIFQKSADRPAPENWEVRNHKNGFVYVQNSGYPTPDIVVQTAKDFMNRHFREMHFAALDVIFHEKKKKAWVLEGNTAPGLEGQTVGVYADYFKVLAKEARA